MSSELGAGQQRPWKGLRREALEESELGGFQKPLSPSGIARMLPCRRPCQLRAPLWAGGPQGRPVQGAGQCPVLPRAPRKRLASVCSQKVPHLAVLGAVLIMKAQTWSHFHREIYREC